MGWDSHVLVLVRVNVADNLQLTIDVDKCHNKSNTLYFIVLDLLRRKDR